MNDDFTNEKLDPPLVVHKITDASYHDNSPELTMNETRVEDDGPTLTRHRFKKEEKKSNKGYIAVIVLVVIAVVIGVLFATGTIPMTKTVETTKAVQSTEAVTKFEDMFEGTIVVKGTYIFVDGYEVDGIQGLQNELKYEDASTTAYTIIDEGADSDYLNNEILPVLMKLGFYGEDTEITHKVSTGLMAEVEASTTTTTTTTTSTTVSIDESNEEEAE